MNKFFPVFTILFLFTILSAGTANAQENRSVKNFHSIANAGAVEVFVKMGDEESLSIEGSDDDLERIETVVQNGILKIRTKRDINNWNVAVNTVKVFITAVKLDALLQSGSGSIDLDGEMSSASADFQLSGSGRIIASMDTQSAKVTLSGSGNIALAGKVGELNITMAGSGDVNADKLEAENTKVKIAGIGTAYINASKTIDAKIVGPGAVKYVGEPIITTKKIGDGSVSKM
ncbi:head GIN domain-containing protein [Pedobacter arcticus]|uniref:head GIN domain-containing protein n=1 Tax=Pedobacter arcticus TaxID=752140 RepID=UPI00037925CD|nr:head GIN domain-containing protein [Pedobacter arcticus]